MFRNIFELYSKAIENLFKPVSPLNTILKVALHSTLEMDGFKEIKIKSVPVKKELSSETIKNIQDNMFQDGSRSWLKHTFEVKTVGIDDSLGCNDQEDIEYHIIIVDNHVKLNKNRLSISKYFFYNRKMPHEYDSQLFEFINAQTLIETFRFRSLVLNTIPKLTSNQIFDCSAMKNLFRNLNSVDFDFPAIRKAILAKNGKKYAEITRGIFLCNNRFLNNWFNGHNISNTPDSYQYKMFDANQALRFGTYVNLKPLEDDLNTFGGICVDYGNSLPNVPLSYVIDSWLNDFYLSHLTKVMVFHAFQIKLTNEQISKLFVLEDKKKCKPQNRKVTKTIIKSTDHYDSINRLDINLPVSKQHSPKHNIKAHAEQLSLF
ncbi:hypothetical protein [Lactobacillus kefiranofaciens]|uniref:Uncharacterized protein n=1 Tax=Lactobacillus kefiranofaciens TaxID=267818 RepID=A0AAX3UE39_9LACO|nr:hypothetical protein [Lactobacillus kefiranofaciens]AEG40776.1 hypothetical protein WANG_1081 [Lactobacillus kefiranofaciens subsp. kefiranofaciens]QFQ68292.1 hypothetical protein LKK75_07855 [Lactobacillus kefiranofaciens subsp. kefiranofaciens]WGO85922.1 hypothetical protein QEJ78_11580 [Lactobacillus kefiranofaciens]WGO86995.1 hypothetical protein QEJ78_11670 [Lactobacillus kefiranofaciens]WQH36759.1 hypothetical protein U2870_03880 [Lactobacillus kefiranofaciens]